MTVLGYIIIEYNQASRWSSLWTGSELLDTVDEAERAKKMAEDLKPIARGETYSIAEVREIIR